MKKCITILILNMPVGISAFEHPVVTGDSLWELSNHYLGSGVQWKRLTYLDGSQPIERNLKVGRLVTDEAQRKETVAVTNPVPTISNTAQSRVMKKLRVTTASPPHTTTHLSFNTRSYCCAEDVVSMDEHGSFQITPQTHPFFSVLDKPNKQKMSSFMNINISEDLLNVFNDH
jgi:hypothetical protein